MSVILQLVLVGGSVAALVGILAGVKFLGVRFGWPAEFQRKCVHVATGTYALSLILVFSEFWPILVLIGAVTVVLLVLRLPRLAKTGIGSALHDVERRSYGELLLAVSVGFVFFFSMGQPVLYVLPIAVLTLSDAAAALIGTTYGRTHFTIEEGTKSIEGVVMFFMVTFIVSAVVLLLMTDIGRLNVVLLSTVIGAFGALIEADSWRGFDNLFIPIGLNIFLANHLATPPTELVGLAVAFGVTLVVLIALAPALKITPHAIQAYTILIFIMLTVTQPYNVIVPVAALVAQLIAGRARPTSEPFPDLDFVATFSVVSLFWLFMGTYMQRNALDVFTLTLAGAGLAFLSLAFRRWTAAAVIGTVAIVCTVPIIAALNHAAVAWEGNLWPWLAATVVVAVGVPLTWPRRFDGRRSAKIAVLAMPVPLALFLMGGNPS